MLEMTIPDMTCGHCMNVITRAIGEIDSNAKVNFDLSTHTVSIAGAASATDLRAAIENAGYTVSDTKQDNASASCCGSCQI